MKKVYNFHHLDSVPVPNSTTSCFIILCRLALWVSSLEKARCFHNYSIRQIGLGLYNGTSLFRQIICW